MIAVCKSDNELRRKWRQQILSHCNPQKVEARKGFVAMTFVDQANTQSRFVDIKDVLAVLVYEDDALDNNRRALRLSAYDVSRIANGVQWGGAENCRLFKDLTLAPQYGARGQRPERGKLEMLALALTLNHRLGRATRYPAAPWPSLRLPQLWAGFRARHVYELRGDGPEFEQACSIQSDEPVDLFRAAAQQIDGLVAYPLDWVSGQIKCAVAVFAEPTFNVRRQVCRIGELPDGLIGYQGASAFDFYNSRFRRLPDKRRSSRRKVDIKVAIPRIDDGKSRQARPASCVA